MHTKILSATVIGVDAHIIEVEVDISLGLVNFYIVGLPDTAIKESSKRIRTALKNCGFPTPCKKITVNLAPADLKKEGTMFDVPIAVGILAAAGQVTLSPESIKKTVILGELSLDGAIRPIKGALAVAYDAQKLGIERIIVPADNAHEAALVNNIEVIAVEHMTQLVSYLRGELPITPATPNNSLVNQTPDLDYVQVKGQIQAKRALQIAAAGNHPILFVGPPGSGKTMLARRLSSIMPSPTFDEILHTNKIYSVSGKIERGMSMQRPFRSPHHTISQAGLVGGGSFPKPGEISLAHNGILFLDELTEFKRDTLEVLRQPLEHKVVCISRANQTVQFPASFLFVAALNPCPCGYFGDSKKACACSAQQIDKYLGKLSGPLLDRIDLQVHVQGIDYETLTVTSHNNDSTYSSATMSQKVNSAVSKQHERFQAAVYNSTMTPDMIDTHCALSDTSKALVKQIFERFNLSMRGYHKLLKIARTIADLDGSDNIETPHIQEATMYRALDRLLEQRKS